MRELSERHRKPLKAGIVLTLKLSVHLPVSNPLTPALHVFTTAMRTYFLLVNCLYLYFSKCRMVPQVRSLDFKQFFQKIHIVTIVFLLLCPTASFKFPSKPKILPKEV